MARVSRWINFNGTQNSRFYYNLFELFHCISLIVSVKKQQQKSLHSYIIKHVAVTLFSFNSFNNIQISFEKGSPPQVYNYTVLYVYTIPP